jgi:hypothetical protein
MLGHLSRECAHRKLSAIAGQQHQYAFKPQFVCVANLAYPGRDVFFSIRMEFWHVLCCANPELRVYRQSDTI